MKIGMIFECGPGGADEKVYKYLAEQYLAGQLRTEIVVVGRTLGSKPKLIEQCGAQAKALLEIDRCEKVVILWDLHPAWGTRGERPCRFNDCKLIMESLKEASFTTRQLQRVHLVCIEQELETLLLADKQAIENYLSSIKRRSCRIGRLRNPEHQPEPKGYLSQKFVDHIGRKYNDASDAEKIIKLADIDKIWCCPSFVRFADKVAGVRRHEF
jgi:hypothetical protein